MPYAYNERSRSHGQVDLYSLTVYNTQISIAYTDIMSRLRTGKL